MPGIATFNSKTRLLENLGIVSTHRNQGNGTIFVKKILESIEDGEVKVRITLETNPNFRMRK